MTITRTLNGMTVEIELTDGEMRDAYWERQDGYYRDDVYSNVDTDDITYYGVEEKDVPAVKEEILKYYKHAMLNSEDWWDVLMTSVSDVCHDWLKQHH